MGVYVYAPNPSNGARDLAHTLGATRLRTFDGMDFRRKGRKFELQAGDIVICWGTPLPELDRGTILNAGIKLNKYKELRTLQEAGILTPAHELWNRERSVPEGWIGRTFNHSGGADMLRITPGPVDYVTKKINISEEYRLHVFDGKSIRAGKKILREGFTIGTLDTWRGRPDTYAHPWVRSYDAGWKISYDDFKSTVDMRSVARASIQALGLTFGAVDIGRTMGGFYVLEVNRAPGADPPTIDAYVRAFKRWLSKQDGKTPDEIIEEEGETPLRIETNPPPDLNLNRTTFIRTSTTPPTGTVRAASTPMGHSNAASYGQWVTDFQRDLQRANGQNS